MKRHIELLLLALALPALALAEPALTLSPTTTLLGKAGETVGWGFTLTNPDANFLVVTGSEFCSTVTIASITVCDQYPSSSLGTYTDYIGQYNFIVVGPAPETSPVSQSFSSSLLTGVGAFTFAPGALYLDNFAGQLLVSYDLYSLSPNDPNFGDAVYLGPGTLVANASVTATPEPGTWLLAAGAGLLLACKRRNLIGSQRPI